MRQVDIRLPESSASEPPVSIVKKATSNSSPSREGEQKADVLRALQPKVPIPPFLTDWQGHRALRGTSPEAPARTPSSKGRYEGNSDSPSITGRAVDRSTELLSDRRNCLSLGSTPRRDYHPVRDSILVPAVGHLPAQVPLQEALRGAYNSRSSLRRLDFNALDAEDKEKRGPEDNSHGQGANLGGRESVMPGELQGQVARPPAVIPASDSGAKRNSLGSFLMELRQRQRL